MSEQEEWRMVPDAPEYEVSSLGRLRSIDRTLTNSLGRVTFHRGCDLKLHIAASGKWYPRTVIRIAGVRRTVGVHQLVCRAFHGPAPTDAHEVRHLNGIRTDCRAENLAWGTRAENMQDAVRHGTHSHMSKTHCPQGHPYDEANTYRKPHNPNVRHCLKCTREQAKLAGRRRRRALREATNV